MAQALADVLTHNESYAASFTQGDLPADPARHLAILTCMDARIMPEQAFGIGIGEAHVLRNAGGRATDDALRSLIVSHRMLGTREIFVVQHTQCGMMTFSGEELREQLREETGKDASHLAFHTFRDLEATVRNDVGKIRACPFFTGDVKVHGFVFDVKTGKLSEVV